MIGRARLTIDSAAIQHNLKIVKQMAPQSRIYAVVKADAYGHGLVETARALSGVAGFAVACVDEAIVLRENGIRANVVVLEGIFSGQDLLLAGSAGLDLVVHADWQVRMLEKDGTSGICRIWLKVDTGMNRLGFSLTDARDAYTRLTKCFSGPVGLLSHLSCADAPDSAETQLQISRFERLRVQNGSPESSLANSAAILAFPGSHYQWVRPGIMLYGVSPFAGRNAKDFGLIPAMRFVASLISVREVNEGESVGYGGQWRASAPTRIGIVSAGYGDGYPWRGFPKAQAWLQGKLAPLVGRVSMDMMAIDLTEIPNANVGDEVTLWGKELGVERVAAWSGTIPYELICGVTRRVRRRYTNQPALSQPVLPLSTSLE